MSHADDAGARLPPGLPRLLLVLILIVAAALRVTALGKPFYIDEITTITVADQHSKSDYNLYEGTEVGGDVETVLIRGTVVVDDGELRVEPGFGQFVARAKFGEELRPAVART